ncbi:MAG: NAD-dependent epimerase/dehydratase family protein [Akkermansiaceae bacterium]|nr:NAD-dependent epimerase/dehydratase family protein [Armatimonadota bacterium]
MKVLIIGGTGLISNAITTEMIRRGRFDITHYNRGQRSRTYDTPVRTVSGDRYDRPAFVRQMRELQDGGERFDVVIEMIGYKPADIESLRESFAGRVGQLLFCSTVDVYSKPPARYPIPNDADQTRPAPWDYAENKARCEAILNAAHAAGDFPVTILRPAHTYDDGGTLLHSLGGNTSYLDRLRRGLPIVTHGDGESLWASCHADDAATAFVNACGNSRAYGKGYALPGKEWLTWNDIHRTVARAVGGPEPRIVAIPTYLLARLTDRAHICAINFRYNNVFDVSHAQADLDFDPRMPFADGAKQVYQTLQTQNRITPAEDDPVWDRVLAVWEKHTATMIAERKEDA